MEGRELEEEREEMKEKKEAFMEVEKEMEGGGEEK